MEQGGQGRRRCWTATIATAFIALALLGVGAAILVDRVAADTAVGVGLLVAGGLGVASLRAPRTARMFASVVAVVALLALLTKGQIAEGDEVALLVESSAETLLLLLGLFAALAPACLGHDAGSGDDLPRVRLCVYGHRFCPFHPSARPEPTALPLAPAAAPATSSATASPSPAEAPAA